MPMLMKQRIAQLVAQAVEEAQRQGGLPAGPVPAIEVEHPQNAEHGDFATSLPLRLARAARMNPMSIAERLVPLVPADATFQRIWAAPPGFINFAVSRQWLQHQVEAIIGDGDSYGTIQPGTPQRIQVEFVSVNPTGPIHVGHARGAVLGSGLASILEAAGHTVSREYYINDAGSQMTAFYRSLYVRYRQALGQEAQMPENGYMGSYMEDLARELVAEEGKRFLEMSEAEAVAAIGAIGLRKMLASIREDLSRIGVEFDVWFSERTLFESGEYTTALDQLRQGGYLAQRDNATWFTSTALGEDKDNVLVRTTGEPTYFASDIAYHHNKFIQRGFDRVINIWGADHQGHVSRMKAAVGALGVDPARLTILISQLVTLKRGDEIVRISKRTGDLITLRELVDEVGSDACRFFFLSRSPDSQMDFDLELAKQQSDANPVYYVQYAYARIAGIMRLAQERRLDYTRGDASLLTHEAEDALIKKMLLLPEMVEQIAESLEPHHLPGYALELATAFHWFYQQCRVVSSDPADEAVTLARLKLVEGCRIVLARCLSLMGMSAPERM
ncbi:MAG: arginine--tRNA ligase [Dehalococcoidia bacterium]|nr:arginine--tRNA ligase [Dehalococcoidia bacterium]